MAYFGINGVGTALTATNVDDSINFFGSTSTLSSNTVLGLDGNDLIYLGAQGYTAVGSATFTTGVASGAAVATGFALNGTGVLLGQDATYVTSWGLTGQSLTGLAGTQIYNLTGVVTSQAAARSLVSTQVYGNAGNDSIYLGGGGFSAAAVITSSTIGGGAGNDIIGTINYINGVSADATAATGGTYEKALVEGGGGDDRILLNIASSTVSAVTVQGSQGNDSITFNVVESDNRQVVTNSFIGGGGGNDLISGGFFGLATSQIAGGGGNDTLRLRFTDSGSKNIIYGDFNAADSQFDGSDLIDISAGVAGGANAWSANTVNAGLGNDTVQVQVVTGAASLNQYFLAGGNDVLSANLISSDSIYAGGGNDSISIRTDAVSGGFQAGYLVLGGGNDTLRLIGSGDEIAGAFSSNTVFGGLGADIYTATVSSNQAVQTAGITIGYDSTLDSTLSAMDTIAILDAQTTGTYSFRYEPGGLSLASFSGAGFTATNGVVVFSATYNNNVTARAEAINSVATAGNVATFEAGGARYLFIAGSTTAGTSDDLVTVVTTNVTGGLGQTAGALTIGAGKNISLTTYD
jgi:hypothetical protein